MDIYIFKYILSIYLFAWPNHLAVVAMSYFCLVICDHGARKKKMIYEASEQTHIVLDVDGCKCQFICEEHRSMF